MTDEEFVASLWETVVLQILHELADAGDGPDPDDVDTAAACLIGLKLREQGFEAAEITARFADGDLNYRFGFDEITRSVVVEGVWPDGSVTAASAAFALAPEAK